MTIHVPKPKPPVAPPVSLAHRHTFIEDDTAVYEVDAELDASQTTTLIATDRDDPASTDKDRDGTISAAEIKPLFGTGNATEVQQIAKHADGINQAINRFNDSLPDLLRDLQSKTMKTPVSSTKVPMNVLQPDNSIRLVESTKTIHKMVNGNTYTTIDYDNDGNADQLFYVWFDTSVTTITLRSGLHAYGAGDYFDPDKSLNPPTYSAQYYMDIYNDAKNQRVAPQE